MRIAAVLVTVLLAVGAAPAVAGEEVNCDPHAGPCTLALGGRRVRLEIGPRPVTAMRELTFIVELSGPPPAVAPVIDLGMPGMRMGPNRVALVHRGGGRYEGRGVIVRCPSGRRRWFAQVGVAGEGAVRFIFDVRH